jgi:DNA mismatch endonuclease, patch repair protein
LVDNQAVPEVWIKTAKSAQLSGRKSRDTLPEVLLRKALHRAGARFRLHRRLAKGCVPDVVLPGRRLAVFVDGDFWHGCPTHYPARNPSGPNRGLWRAKFDATHIRDERATQLAQEAGWTVVRLWECEIKSDPNEAAGRVLRAASL